MKVNKSDSENELSAQEWTISPWRGTLFIWLFGLFKVPLIWYVRPTVIELNHQRTRIRISLRWRTKNHLKSMYFGVLAIGADLAGGILAMMQIRAHKANVSLVFKDIHGEFLKRPEDDVVFTCDDGPAIADLVKQTIESSERQNLPVTITATCPTKFGDEPVARFTLTLSLKRRV